MSPPHPNLPLRQSQRELRGLPHSWAGENLTLYAHRAIYWPRERTLIVADTHFGKDAAFRHAGIALPHGTTAADLLRLSELLAYTGAQRLLVLGDFFHAPHGRQVDMLSAVAQWREEWMDLHVTNVRGNHDLKAGDPPAEWRIELVDEPHCEPPFAWQHHPSNIPGFHSMGGHLHPAVLLEGMGNNIKAPCFWFRSRSAVVPSFSDFTGSSRVKPRPGDAVFAVNGDEIAELAIG